MNKLQLKGNFQILDLSATNKIKGGYDPKTDDSNNPGGTPPPIPYSSGMPPVFPIPTTI